jgi:acyl-CoA synthetase (AMP-forming)/AMP-acid ligase II
MGVPLTLIDFLERGAPGGDRVAVVDEPDGSDSLGELTHVDLECRSPSMACALDRMVVGHWARIAIVSRNSARYVIALFGVSGGRSAQPQE